MAMMPIRCGLFRTEYLPRRHGFAVIVDEVAPMSLHWCLRVGDIANNYRASLDHLAWALVSRGRTPPGTGKLTRKEEGRVSFPISRTRSDFNGVVARKLPGVRRADRARVRRRQPYHYSARTPERHAFALLAKMNNDDKHRTIQALWQFPASVGIEVMRVRDCELRQAPFRRRAGFLEAGTELAILHARKRGLTPELEVRLEVTAEPTTDQRISILTRANRCGALIFD